MAVNDHHAARTGPAEEPTAPSVPPKVPNRFEAISRRIPPVPAIGADMIYMQLALFFFIGIPALVVTGVILGPGILRHVTARRVIAQAERSVGMRRAWVRVPLIIVPTWAAVSLTTMTWSPSAGVWLGGLVVALGAGWGVARSSDTYSMDDEAFDVAVRQLLDQA